MIQLPANNQRSADIGFPDLTALLDVIFILLVFLLLTANVAPKALTVSLPEKGREQARDVNQKSPITITLFAGEERWALDGKEYVNWLVFELSLSEKIRLMEDPQIIIAGDKHVSLERLLQLFSWLQGHDLSAAQVLMRPD